MARRPVTGQTLFGPAPLKTQTLDANAFKRWLDERDGAPTVEELLEDTFRTYARGGLYSVTVGSILKTHKEGFAYKIAPESATDHHTTTAGGVKLYVLPIGGYVYCDAFADFSTAIDPHLILRKAEAAVPVGGTLVLPSSADVVECDVPASGDLAIFSVTKKMTVLGGQAELKIKDFASAYVTYTSAGNWCAIAVRTGKVTLRGVKIDCNADNHYEIDGDGYKWWEAGPTLKRPANGIKIYCGPTEANIEDVVIEQCEIRRALSSVCAVGGLGVSPALDDADFLDGTRTEGLIVKPTFRLNRSSRARGNDFLFTNGVTGGVIHDNYCEDSSYHSVRFYTACIDCHAHNNKVYTDYARIAAKYNSSDLGYWRTDKASASPGYKITRSGMRIGSGYSAQTAVVGCSLRNNIIRYADNVVHSIIDGTTTEMSAFQLQETMKGHVIEGNVVYNAPVGILRYFLPPGDAEYENDGCVLKGNIGHDPRGMCFFYQGRKIQTEGNKALRAVKADLVMVASAETSSWQTHRDYEITKSDGTAFTRIVEAKNGVIFFDGFDTKWSSAFALVTSATLLGNATRGVEPTLLNSWANAATGGTSVTTGYNVSGGWLHVQGALTAAAATADKVFDLPLAVRMSFLRPNLRFPVVNTATAGGSTVGDSFAGTFDGQAFSVVRNGATPTYLAFAWSVPIETDIRDILEALV